MFRILRPPHVRVLLAGVLAVVLGGCVNPASERLAELPVLTTVPDGVEVIERRSGTEIGGWPSVGPQAQVSYRVVQGDPEEVLEQIREIALVTGWDLEPASYLTGSLETDDGLARFSAFNRSATDEVIVSVWL